MNELIDLVLHADDGIRDFVIAFGSWVYLLLFAIVFLETGIVLMPFLPGDSLLFTVGAMAADQWMNTGVLLPLLVIAAVTGDGVNYLIGRSLGGWLFTERSRWFRKDYLDRAHSFYETHGARAIVLARFVPILRTFVPFAAGVARMDYRKFGIYNVVGGLVWVTLFLTAGYLLGSVPIVKENFSALILAVIVLSILPMATGFRKKPLRKS